ncbi:MAG TPA: hypothetical protein VMA09_04890 [Candidatus Binataceae bacterium]|nr:hypothetical protein [Candidatus Binataceae bacterium]
MPVVERRSSVPMNALLAPPAALAAEVAPPREPDAVDQFVEHFIRCLKDGICPTCDTAVDFEQKGIHVFGSCGHRIYIGLRPPNRRKKRAA